MKNEVRSRRLGGDCLGSAASYDSEGTPAPGRFPQPCHDLIAPDIFPGETASALTKSERQKAIAVGDAAALYIKILGACPSLYPYLPLVPRAIDISSQTRTAFYDCLYVALAEQEQCEVVTVDDKFINGIQKQFPFVIHLASIP